MFAQVQAARDHQDDGSNAKPDWYAAHDRREEGQPRDVSAREGVGERDLQVREELDGARAIPRRRGVRDDELQRRLDEDRRDDEQRDQTVAPGAARAGDREAEGDAEGDFGLSEEPDDRADRVQCRTANGLEQIERPLIEAYSASSKSSFERRKYQKPMTKMTSANAAEYARRSHSGGRPSSSARWFETTIALIGLR